MIDSPAQTGPMRVYVDTSVFGGAFDEEFCTASETFFQQVKVGRFILVVSSLVQEEIRDAPAEVQRFFDTILAAAEIAEVDPQARQLQQAYFDADVVSERWADDALHVALATVSGAAAIVSWNFRHIVNYQKIPLYNAVNVRCGFRAIAIYSPNEMTAHEDEDI